MTCSDICERPILVVIPKNYKFMEAEVKQVIKEKEYVHDENHESTHLRGLPEPR